MHNVTACFTVMSEQIPSSTGTYVTWLKYWQSFAICACYWFQYQDNSLRLLASWSSCNYLIYIFTRLYALQHFCCWAAAGHYAAATGGQHPSRQASWLLASSLRTRQHDCLHRMTRRKLSHQPRRSNPTRQTSPVTRHLLLAMTL